MSANLFGERFVYRKEPGWHGLGIPMAEGETCVDGVIRAKADFCIIKTPVFGTVETVDGKQSVSVTDRIMILREPTKDDPEYRFLGFASPTYGIIQNMDIAKSLDILTDKWPCETVGVLGKGETLFVSLDAGEIEIAGEFIHQYFLVTDTRNGGTAMKIAFTPVRVVCQNTLVTGLRSSIISVAMEHVANVHRAFDSRLNLIKQLENAKELTLSSLKLLAKCQLTKNDIDFVLTAVYPMPKYPKKAELLQDTEHIENALVGALYEEATKAQQSFEYYCNRAKAYREQARVLFGQFNDEYSATANTAWALYNAVVESADYRDGAKSVVNSSIWGARANEKKRAFASVLAIATRK